MGIMKFKLYNSKSAYITRLNLVNKDLGFPNKNYSKIINGIRKHFVADKIMTRTWAEENPRETKLNQFPFPVEKSMETSFTGFVEYNPEWFEEIEPKIISK